MSDNNPGASITFIEKDLGDSGISVTWAANNGRDWKRALRLIKSTIPSNARTYDRSTKQWVIAKSHIHVYEQLRNGILEENPEIVSTIDEAIDDEAVASMVERNISMLPASMRKRAVYTIRAIVNAMGGETETETDFCYSKQQFGAYDPDQKVWYYEDGRYSQFSPKELDRKCFNKSLKRLERVFDEKYARFNDPDFIDDYLITAKQIFRVETLERYGRTCYICGDTPELDKLHMHRVIPGKDGGQYSEDNVVLVCSKCHKSVEGLSWKEIHALHQSNSGGTDS